MEEVKVIVKEIQYGELEKGRMYCIKDGAQYIFTLDNFDWSIAIRNEKELEEGIQKRSFFHGWKDHVMDEMRKMMNEIDE